LWRDQYGGFGAYYEDSTIDKYLNTVFFNTLNQAVRDAIVDSDIIITDKSSWDFNGLKTKNILRRVFLLSSRELNIQNSYTAAPEGQPLKYFTGAYSRKVAALPDGKKGAYWTRTPEIWETYNVFTIGDRASGAGGADIHSGVRPAFCIKKTKAITQRTDIISGQTVYAVE